MKGKSFKAISVALCLALSASLFFGCGKSEETTPSVAAGDTTASITTAVDTTKEEVKMETIQVWTNNAATKTEDEKMVADFNNGSGKEKGINIEYKIYGGDYTNVLNVAAAAGQAPNLFKVTLATIPQFVNASWIVPLEDIEGGADYLKKYDGYLQPGYNIYKGKTYTVPIGVSTLGVAYNKDLLKKNGFDKAPETWAELREMAKTITKNGNGKEYGFIEGLKSTGYVSTNGLWHYVASIGHGEFDAGTGKFNFADFKPFLQTMVDMRNDGSWFPGVEGLNNDQARAQFAEGNIGFKLSASWDAGVWQDQFHAKMDWGICRPVEDVNNRYKDFTYQTISIILGAKAKEAPAKSLEVFKAFTSDEQAVALYEAGKTIPYKDELIKAAKNQPTVKNFAGFADMTNSYKYLWNPRGDMKIEGDNLEAVISKVLTLTVPVDKAVADLDKRYNETLDKAVADGYDVAPFVDKTDTSLKAK